MQWVPPSQLAAGPPEDNSLLLMPVNGVTSSAQVADVCSAEGPSFKPGRSLRGAVVTQTQTYP